MDCAKGIYRLLIVGAPERVGGQDDQSEAVHIAEAVQHFITTMDAIKLELRDVDEIQPLISDLFGSLNKVKGLPPDFDGKDRVALANHGFSDLSSPVRARVSVCVCVCVCVRVCVCLGG